MERCWGYCASWQAIQEVLLESHCCSCGSPLASGLYAQSRDRCRARTGLPTRESLAGGVTLDEQGRHWVSLASYIYPHLGQGFASAFYKNLSENLSDCNNVLLCQPPSMFDTSAAGEGLPLTHFSRLKATAASSMKAPAW